MGFFDIFSCCGSRRDKLKDPEPVSYHVIRMEPRNLWLTDGVLNQASESATLLPPARAESIVSADSLTGYGATEQHGLTEEQRTRVAAIGREVGR